MTRKVCITGATSGIGLATAHAFAKNGDQLLLCGRRTDRLAQIQADLEETYAVQVSTYMVDVRDLSQVEQATTSMLAQHGSIDILVNNAGIAFSLESFETYPIADMDQMIDTNVKGLLYMSRAILPSMLERNQGHIINIGSTAGMAAYGGGAVYCASKAAVKTISNGLRIDTITSNIRVTTVQPGIVQTDFSRVRFHGDQEKADAVYAGIAALQAEDIADVILYTANQPQHVQISDVTIMANQQATGSMIHRERTEY